MWQAKLSKQRENELIVHLRKRGYGEVCVKTTVQDVNRVRCAERPMINDWLPGLEQIVKYSDVFESFRVLDFLIL